MKEKEYNKVLSEIKDKTNFEFIINNATITLRPKYTKFEDGLLSELYLTVNASDESSVLEYFTSCYGESYYDGVSQIHYWYNAYKAIEFGVGISIKDIYFTEKYKYQAALENQRWRHPVETIDTTNAMKDSINRLDSIKKRRLKEAYSEGL